MRLVPQANALELRRPIGRARPQVGQQRDGRRPGIGRARRRRHGRQRIERAAAGGDGDFRALRRLHLLAQRHQALAVVLRPARQAQAPSPAALRLHLASAGARLEVTLLKRRGRPLLEPVTLALRPAHWESARVDTDTAPRVLPAKNALLDAQRPLDTLLA